MIRQHASLKRSGTAHEYCIEMMRSNCLVVSTALRGSPRQWWSTDWPWNVSPREWESGGSHQFAILSAHATPAVALGPAPALPMNCWSQELLQKGVPERRPALVSIKCLGDLSDLSGLCDLKWCSENRFKAVLTAQAEKDKSGFPEAKYIHDIFRHIHIERYRHRYTYIYIYSHTKDIGISIYPYVHTMRHRDMYQLLIECAVLPNCAPVHTVSETWTPTSWCKAPVEDEGHHGKLLDGQWWKKEKYRKNTGRKTMHRKKHRKIM